MPKKLDAFIAFKTLKERKKEMRRLAVEADISLSEYLNRLCDRHIKRKRKLRI